MLPSQIIRKPHLVLIAHINSSRILLSSKIGVMKMEGEESHQSDQMNSQK
jgi:hypothetical protein